MSSQAKPSPQNEAYEGFQALLDNLALEVVTKGSKAISKECLQRMLDAALSVVCPGLVEELRGLQGRLAKRSFSADESNACVSRLQAILAAAAGQKPMIGQETIGQPATTLPTATPAAFTGLFKDDPEIVLDFITESSEHLAEIDEKILLLERDPSLIDLLHAVFRGFHTIKGLAGFLELREIQAVAHEVETLLDHARNLRLTITPSFVDVVLETSEYLKEEIARLQAALANAPLPEVRNNRPLLEELSRANAAVDNPSSLTNAEELRALDALLASQSASRLAAVSAAAKPADVPENPATPIAAATPIANDPPVCAAPEAELELSASTALVPVNPVPTAAPTTRQSNRGGETVNSSIRVETQKLDRLMDMVGEMVIAQSILSNSSRTGGPAEVRTAGEMSQLARITAEVQRCAMSMRMMPIGPLFQKNAKMVRDLARRNGKQVNLELSGESTELDKSIAEELGDPLLHMIRNALDHGIETPDERLATGKPSMATLRIAAQHQSGQIVISISDDGRGLDTNRIFKKAVENGLVDANAALTQDEIFHLIFAPGFSTAEKITDISGRGVGMDVVRQHVQTLRGRIGIESELGKGTTFSIFLPLTLAIIEGLVIVVGDHRYIVPLFSVREMFRPAQDMLFSVQGKDEMILMRGNLLPIVRLHKRFNIQPRTEDLCQGLLVVCEFGGKLFCLFVDDLLGRQEVVVKSLDEAFKNVRGLTGSAILGDGRIGLILDVAGIFQHAQLGPQSGAKSAVQNGKESLAA
jgi:two-component system chemotaxis sensor kinase CheA